MRHKTTAVRIAAALGIPLFPLGAFFFPGANKAPLMREAIPDAGIIEAIPAAVPEQERQARTEPEILALAFRRPARKAAGKQTSGPDRAVRAAPVPGEDKFSYLGLIRESDGREWLCVKEEATGRVIFLDSDPAAINEERCVFEIAGVSYSIGRN
jgi:hypothetical protein